MISIVLKDGQIVNINATKADWCEKSRTVRLINEINKDIVARINMDNVAGWVDSKYVEGGMNDYFYKGG